MLTLMDFEVVSFSFLYQLKTFEGLVYSRSQTIKFCNEETRKDSNRMRTVRCSGRRGGGGALPTGLSTWGCLPRGSTWGVSIWGVCACMGCLLGGVNRMTAQWGGCLPRGCLPEGVSAEDVCPGGCLPGGSAQGNVCLGDVWQTPPREQND